MKLSEVKILMLGLTNRCNAKCITCWHSNERPFSPNELLPRVYEELRKKLFPSIDVLDVCGGGEVFFSPLFDTLLQDIQKYDFKTIITSNFSMISREQRELLATANVEFVVSLDGSHSELQSFLRPGCSFDNVVRNIQYFVSNGNRVTIQTTVSDHNFYDMGNMIELAEDLRVDGIRFHSARYLGHLDQPTKFKNPSADMDYIREITSKNYGVRYAMYFDFYHKMNRDPLLKRIKNHLKGMFPDRYLMEFCQNTRRTIKVQEDGKVLSCCLPESRVMGDLNKSVLEEIIDTPRYDSMRRTCACQMMGR